MRRRLQEMKETAAGAGKAKARVAVDEVGEADGCMRGRGKAGAELLQARVCMYMN